MAIDAIPQQVQFTFTAIEKPFATVQFFKTTTDGVAKAFDFLTKVSSLKVLSKGVEVLPPAIGITSDGRTGLCPLSQARGLTEVDFLSHARADITARVPHQGPTHRRGALSVVMNVLLGFVRVVPDDFLFESACRLVVIDLEHFGAHNPFEGVQHGAGSKAFDRCGPVRAAAQTHRVVIPISEPEAKQQAPRRLES